MLLLYHSHKRISYPIRTIARSAILAENEGTGHSYSGMIDIENAIIAVSDAGRIKITEIYNEVKRRFKTYYLMLRSAPSYVYTITDVIICHSLSNEYSFDKKSVIEEIFGFKTNGGEVDIQYDNSWTKNKDELYTKEEIAKIDSDTRVATDMKGLITEPIYNGEHMYSSFYNNPNRS